MGSHGGWTPAPPYQIPPLGLGARYKLQKGLIKETLLFSPSPQTVSEVYTLFTSDHQSLFLRSIFDAAVLFKSQTLLQFLATSLGIDFPV